MQIFVVDIWLEDLPRVCEANSKYWNLIPGGFPAAINQVLDYTLFWTKGEHSLKSTEEHFLLVDYMWENGLLDDLDGGRDCTDFQDEHRQLSDSITIIQEQLLARISAYLPDFHLLPLAFAMAIRPDMVRIGIKR